MLFDKFNPHWNNYDRRQNAIFVGKVLGELNDLLHEYGYVTLNEARVRLGFGGTESSEGDFEGWVLHPEPGEGDGYISFGVWDGGFTRGMDWIEGRSDILKIKFNIDRVPLAISLSKKKQKDREKWKSSEEG